MASTVTGMSVSSLSKIENGQRSLTYDKLVHLADVLKVDIARLFSDAATDGDANPHRGRRSVQGDEGGFVVEAGVYTYSFLAEDLIGKKFSPVLMLIHARSVDEFEGLLRHKGEEFAFVLEGEVIVHTDVYAPLHLKAGQSVYFDSRLGHAYLNAGEGTAKLLTVASDARSDEDEGVPAVALPAAPRRSPPHAASARRGGMAGSG